MRNVRRLAGFGSIALAVFGARPLAARTLPPEVFSATNGQAVRSQVQTFVTAQVTKLADADPVAQAGAREALITEVQPASPSQPQPSQPFLDDYADALADALKPLSVSPDTRVRLNAAILVARVGERTNDTHLVPLIINLLGDQSDAVVLWAVKATHFAIPPALGVAGQKDQLLPAFATAVQKHRHFAPIVDAAYDSLRFYSQGQNATPAIIWAQLLPKVIDEIQTILESRIADYSAGIPMMPAAEPTATSFLVDGQVWRVETPAQKLRSVQIMADLVSCIAQRWQTANVADKADLASVSNKITDGLYVVSLAVANDALSKAVQTKISPATSAADMATRADTIRKAIASVPDFAKLKPAPVLPPTSQPASAP